MFTERTGRWFKSNSPDMKKKKKLKLVRVYWVDSNSRGSWIWIDDFEQWTMYCESVGYIVAEDKKNISVAGSIGPAADGAQIQGIMTIPKCCVTKIERLRAK